MYMYYIYTYILNIYIYILYIYITILYKYIYIYISYIYIYMYIFTTDRFFVIAIESWPEWDLNPRPLNYVQTL